MTLQPNNVDLHTRLNSCSRAASAAVILIGGLGLIGLALDIAALKSVFPGLATWTIKSFGNVGLIGELLLRAGFAIFYKVSNG